MAIIARNLPWVRVAVVAILAWSATAIPVMAATPPGVPADTSKSWVVPYTIVVLAIALGLMIVCRSANRSKEVKHTEFDDD